MTPKKVYRVVDPSVAANNRILRSRLTLVDEWAEQLENFPQGPITRSQVAATLRVFLNHVPEGS